MEKRTQRDFYNGLIAFVNGESTDITPDEFVDFCNGRIAMLDKKSANKKPSKTAEQNEVLKSVILESLTAIGEPVTVSDLIAKTPALAGLSNQKVSAVLKMMKDEGTVNKVIDKKKALFSLA